MNLRKMNKIFPAAERPAVPACRILPFCDGIHSPKQRIPVHVRDIARIKQPFHVLADIFRRTDSGLQRLIHHPAEPEQRFMHPVAVIHVLRDKFILIRIHPRSDCRIPHFFACEIFGLQHFQPLLLILCEPCHSFLLYHILPARNVRRRNITVSCSCRETGASAAPASASLIKMRNSPSR